MPSVARRDVLLRSRVKQFTGMLHGLEKGDVRALHRTRVATRRLRELLPVLQLDGDVTRKLGRQLRKVTQRLGSVRELDVLMLLIDELHEAEGYRPDALRRVAAVVNKERKVRRQRLMAKLPAAQLQRLADKLEDLARELAPDERSTGSRHPSAARGWRLAIDARVMRRAAQLRNAIEAAGAVYVPERLHAVRVALKKLRYALEAADEASGSRLGPDVRALEHVQDLLGRIHDRQLLIDCARQVQASVVPPTSTTWRGFEALGGALENDCRRLHGPYLHERDTITALCRRLADRGRTTGARRVSA